MFGAAGARRLRDRAPYAGRNNRRPYSQHPLRCPVLRSFCILQVFIAFAVIFCPLLVGRPRDHVRRGWGVPLRDHTPLCRAQRQRNPTFVRRQHAGWFRQALVARETFFLRSGYALYGSVGE